MPLKAFFWMLFLTASFATPTLAQNTDDELLTYLYDRAAIQDLMTQYETAHNTTDPEIYRQIFADNVKIISPEGKIILNGIEELVANVKIDRVRFNPDAKDEVRTYSVFRHLVTNMEINVTGNTASSHCYLLMIANNPAAKRPEIVAMGGYNNTYVKKDGKWRISTLIGYFDWGSDEMAKLLQIGPYTPAGHK